LETFGPLQELLRSLADLVRPFTAQVLARSELYSWLWLTGSLIAIDLLYRLANLPRSKSLW